MCVLDTCERREWGTNVGGNSEDQPVSIIVTNHMLIGEGLS